MEYPVANFTALQVCGIGVRRAGCAVLHDIHLWLRAGEIVGVVGPPDAGKTTLLKVLGGLITPSSGAVQVDGMRRDLCCDAWRARVGFAFQNDALFDDLSVFENVAFALRRRDWAATRITARVRDRLGEVGLLAAAQRLPQALSGGMRKRVGIARATASDAAVGLFDDPIAGLDPQTGRRIMALLSQLTRGRGLATCIVANDLPQLLPYCDRVVMLHEGRMVFEGLPRDAVRSRTAAVQQFFTGGLEGPL